MDIAGEDARLEASARCGPGDPAAPDLAGFPLLAWEPGRGAITEDGKVSVAELSIAWAGGIPPARIALWHGTTPAHVEEALRFARSIRSC